MIWFQVILIIFFGIEGLDYLENIDDIDILYSLGVRSVNPVWNNDNKFGGGVKSECNKGLTSLGEELILKLVQSRIAIDLSHSNEKTFFDITNLCIDLKNNGLEPIVFASHSNAKALCNVPRNLTDNQILKIKELDGVIGLVSIKRFCIDITNVNDKNSNFENAYINQIKYLKNLLGFIDNVAVSTDDMSYYYIQPEYYKNANIFSHNNVCEKLRKLLLDNCFDTNEVDKILYKNFENKILVKI